jgi:hypothetical protein
VESRYVCNYPTQRAGVVMTWEWLLMCLGTIEIFLPSYADYHFDTELERRQDPVADIIVTDEEVGRMFPE